MHHLCHAVPLPESSGYVLDMEAVTHYSVVRQSPVGNCRSDHFLKFPSHALTCTSHFSTLLENDLVRRCVG